LNEFNYQLQCYIIYTLTTLKTNNASRPWRRRNAYERKKRLALAWGFAMIYADGKVGLAEVMGFSNLMIGRQIYNGLKVKKNLLFKKRLEKKRQEREGKR